MATLSLSVGKKSIEDIVVHSDDMKELLAVHHEIKEITSRTKNSKSRGNASIQVRHVQGNDFFEASIFLGDGKYANKRLSEYKKSSRRQESVNFYIGGTTPWVLYDKENEQNYVQYDYVNDALIKLGFKEALTWYPADSDKKGGWTLSK